MVSGTANIILCIAALLGAVVVVTYSLISFRSRRFPHPPGPRGYPFIGNLTVPADPAWKTYRRWSEIYGE